MNYRFKVELTDPEGKWDPIWWSDASTLEEAILEAEAEAAVRLELKYDPRECQLSVTDRETNQVIFTSPAPE